ncbi:efflux RND transporter periplasmic adaptor subunit [Flavobacterium pectinovorum]|uniref:efflux RND transporter periplasmic adaptor subunit n=1 Tax=Flavobacterium pectinovorum TaxID=29533 RepID=UPI0026601095|nr:efflux RND transporter periplasmic adaptor subunit [Flavobacterium pectinovorum]WKL49792.1 efflux RND transporter periplasmic adaptor subunit [Flavobacterium pectinovorum]
MNKKTKITIATILIAIAIGTTLYAFTNKKEVLQIETVHSKNGNISNVITATGTIEATKQVEVGTQVSGVVQKIYVDYNSTVKAGQLIAELDKENLQELLQQAKSAYNVALQDQNYKQVIYDRQNQLYKANVISKADYQEALFNLNTAKGTAQQQNSNLRKAQTNLGYANIYSPIDGVVLSKDVDEGQTVAASYSTPTLFTIAKDLKQMQVEANVDEADIGAVKEGQRVTFMVDAFPDEEFSGAVTQVRLNSTVTSNVVTYTVIIKADNPEEKLKPGLTATVSIYTMELKDVMTLEAKAFAFEPDMTLLNEFNKSKNGPTSTRKIDISKDKKIKTIWVYEDGIREQQVVVGKNDGINYEIISGLAEGNQVVTALKKQQAGTQGASGSSSSPFMPKPPGKK